MPAQTTQSSMATPLDYREFIVSNQCNYTYTHRCPRDLVDRILREGLFISGGLKSTATWQPDTIGVAEAIYIAGENHGDSCIIIRIPREILDKARVRSNGSAELTRELSYFHPTARQFTLKPEFVVAWIDRQTNEVHVNPYKDRNPVAGHEEFDHMFG